MMNIEETLLTNGTIHSLTKDGSGEAMLIRGEEIVTVGSESACRAYALQEPAVVDLQERTVIPGFVDAHCHPLMFGQFNSWVDCSWGAASTIDEVVARLTERAALAAGGPVRGEGFHHGNVAEQRMLTRHDLDRVAQDREVLVFHSSGHGAIANTWALEQAGVTRDTPDPDGGHFGRDEAGELTGEVWDAAADVLTGVGGVKITNNGPNFHIPESRLSLMQHLAAAQHSFLAAGVTTVVDAQVTSRELGAYFDLRDEGGLKFRVEMLVISSYLDELETLGLGRRLGDDRLAFSGIKLYVDGALTGATARFSEPYCCSPDDFGYYYHDPTELIALIERADRLGLQTATHAQGDAAIGVVLQAHEECRNQRTRTDVRHRIEHFGAPTPEQVHRTRELELWPVTQPQYLRRYGDELTRVLGARAHRLSPLGEMRDAGVPVVLSSDAPVCPPQPFEAAFAAVSRETLQGATLGGDDLKLTVEEALRGHTLGAAASIHKEHRVGSLAEGKLADFIVLNLDPLSIPLDEVVNVQVEETWVSGQKVFAKE